MSQGLLCYRSRVAHSTGDTANGGGAESPTSSIDCAASRAPVLGAVGSTGSLADREAKLKTFRRQYDAIRGRRFATFEREPTLLGTCAGRGHEVLIAAVALGPLRFGMKRAAGEPEWPDEGTRR